MSATLDTAARRARARLVAAGAPPEQLAGAADQVERAKLDVWVGSDDKLVRKIEAEVAGEGVTMRFQAQLSEVNDPQTIEAPDEGQRRAAGQRARRRDVRRSAAGSRWPPAPIRRRSSCRPTTSRSGSRARVAEHRKALILFTQPRGLDDQATAEAVRGVARQTKALVLTDDVRNTKRYGKLSRSWASARRRRS